jgi:hypothetical protein
MFRINNSSSSGGLYKQLTVFFSYVFEESSCWQDAIDTDLYTSTKRQRGKFLQRSLNTKAAKTQFFTLKIDIEIDFTLIGLNYISFIITVYMVITVTNEQCAAIWHVQVQLATVLCELLYCPLLIINRAGFCTENFVLDRYCYREKSHWCKSSDKGSMNKKSNLYISKLNSITLFYGEGRTMSSAVNNWIRKMQYVWWLIQCRVSFWRHGPSIFLYIEWISNRHFWREF